MKVTAIWTVTEHHSAVIEVDDGLTSDEIDALLDSSALAEVEDGDSYDSTEDRQLDGWEVCDV